MPAAKLGDDVIDVVSGARGIAVTYSESLDGSSGFWLQPKARDGKKPSTIFVDSIAAHVMKAGAYEANLAEFVRADSPQTAG